MPSSWTCACRLRMVPNLPGRFASRRVNSSAVIVMITGEEDRTVMTRAFEAGVEFFLFKPVERNKLLKADPCYGRSNRARKAAFHPRSAALQNLDGSGQ